MQCAAVVRGILKVSSQAAPRKRRIRSSNLCTRKILKGMDCTADSGILNMNRATEGQLQSVSAKAYL
jgi:hypothetical protein